jgi:signal transduction histidine kinase
VNKSPSLRSKVNKISVVAFLLASALMAIGFVVYSKTKNALAEEQLLSELQRNSKQQIEQLIPSFLLPEQMAGVNLLLERIRKDENLSDIRLLSLEGSIPDSFSQCSLSHESQNSCQNQSGSETAIVVPVKEGSQHFGWLFKAKANSSAIAYVDLLQMMGIFILVMVITFVFVYVLTARILATTLPKALDGLVEWVKADLEDRSAEVPALPFKELEDLKDKIGEVLERHTEERDQAVVGQLTRGIMHDIRTPMASVVAAMHMVDRSTDADAKRVTRLENLYSMAKTNLPIIAKIIETTLDGSRSLLVERRPSDLVTTVREAISFNKDLAELRKAKIEYRGPVSLVMEHDPVQVGRVIFNLIKNGIEASNSSSEPIVVLTLTALESGRAQITIEDNGPGFQRDASRVFRVFRSSKLHGNGLGLHVSKKIVESHFGSIRASNASMLGGAMIEFDLRSSPSEGTAL